MREKSQSHSDLLTEEGEKVGPRIHNNPPEILRPLSFISPSLKFAYGTVQENLHSFPVWFIHICFPLKNSRLKDRLFFLLYINEPTLNQKKSAVQDQKKGGVRRKKPPPVEEKNSPPPKTKNIGAPIKK